MDCRRGTNIWVWPSANFLALIVTLEIGGACLPDLIAVVGPVFCLRCKTPFGSATVKDRQTTVSDGG